MGIYCEINLLKPADGAYSGGSVVSGVIKYAVDEETVFKKITVSLKGSGRLIIKDRNKKRHKERHISNDTYRNGEVYIDVDHVAKEDNNGFTVPIGSYELPFSFKLPVNIPASLEYYNRTVRYIIRCIIQYYIRIKFERPGMLKFAKHYRKEIPIVTGITPKLSTVPTVYGEDKSLFKFNIFARKPSVVKTKANVETSVVKPGAKIELDYEVINDSHVNVKGVETKLMERYTFFTRGGRKIKVSTDVQDSDSKTGVINIGAMQTMPVVINVPFDKCSLENSKLVSRDYIVLITAELPMPHWNSHLEIPIQIGDWDEGNVERPSQDDPPPSYWEAMGEFEKEDNVEDFDIPDDK